MVNKLLEKIKELENEIEYIKEKNGIVIKNIKSLFSKCKIEKDKKEKFKNKLIQNLNALKIEHKKIFIDGILNFDEFLKLIKNEKDLYILAVRLPEDKIKIKYMYSFFTKKFDFLFTVKDDILLGTIYKKHLNEIKNLKSLPFYNSLTEEFDEIELFKVVFEAEDINKDVFDKIINIFNSLYARPSFRKKHFIEFSLIKNKIVNFEMEKIKEEKNRYKYIYEETYPSLEVKLKQNINNPAFVLALLERIDNEIEEIKNSRGIANVINRILNYIDLKSPEKELKRITKILRDSLKKENNLI